MVYVVLVVLWGEALPAVAGKNLNYKLGSYGMMHTRVREASQVGDVDVLILGASDAYRGFDTRIFEQTGYKTFNLGSSSQSPLQTRWLLHRYLDALKPEIVIYTVTPFVMCSDGVESSLDLIANEHIDLGTLNMTLRVKNVKPLNTFIYGSYRQTFGLDDAFTEPKETDEDLYIPGGYVQKKIADYNENFKAVLGGEDLKYNERQVDAFFEIIRTLNDKGIKIYLVKTPVAHYDAYNHPLWLAIEKQLKETAPYFNFNLPPLGFADSLHFSDQYHLNQAGVVKFNQLLIDSLLK